LSNVRGLHLIQYAFDAMVDFVKAQSTVRTFETFYDATEGYEFSKPRAEVICQAAAELIGRYTGPIALSPMQGLRINLGDSPITPFNVNFGTTPYKILMTKRVVVGPDKQTVSSYSMTKGRLRRPHPGAPYKLDGFISASESGISNANNLTDSTLTVLTAHEMAHTFTNPNHCPETDCLRQFPFEKSSTNAKLLNQDDPFCDNCVQLLEQGGQLAAGAVMLKDLGLDG
jgi:hypothetical protein